MRKKHFTNIVLIGIIIVFLGMVKYFSLKSLPEVPESNFTKIQNTESKILADLKTNWQSVQKLIPLRPSYQNKEENKKKIWGTPYIVQFIGKDNIIVETEDDNSSHVVLLHFDGNKFNLLEFFKNQYNFTSPDYQNLLNKYSDSSYDASTYTIGLVRDGKAAFFRDLTKVPENIFVKGYSSLRNL